MSSEYIRIKCTGCGKEILVHMDGPHPDWDCKPCYEKCVDCSRWCPECNPPDYPEEEQC